jgi:3-methyladenine DNA glycosylase Tag
MNCTTKPDEPTTDAGYLEAAARIIFMGGLNRQVVDGKWLGFRQMFSNFEVAAVAELTPDDVDRIAQDDRVIKYRAKLAAVVTNARTMAAISAEHGSFAAYVDELYAKEGPGEASRALAKEFSYVSEQGAKHWLYATGYDIGEVTDKVQRKYAPFAE